MSDVCGVEDVLGWIEMRVLQIEAEHCSVGVGGHIDMRMRLGMSGPQSREEDHTRSHYEDCKSDQ